MTTESLCQRYLAAQLDRDSSAALRVLIEDGLEAGVSVPELYLEVMQPAQYEIGRLWQANALSVAEEHLATSISHLALSVLYRSIPRAAPNGWHVLVGCLRGERHDLGARIVADFYEMAGFSVRYLGVGVEEDRLVAMVREDQPDILALSVTMTANLPALPGAVDLARSAVGDRLRLVVGGPACGALLSVDPLVRPDIVAVDVGSAVARSTTLLGAAAMLEPPAG